MVFFSTVLCIPQCVRVIHVLAFLRVGYISCRTSTTKASICFKIKIVRVSYFRAANIDAAIKHGVINYVDEYNVNYGYDCINKN